MSLNDSTLLIVASGLHTINLNTGSGWDYNTITGKKDYTETIAKNTIGTAVGLMTGTYIISTGSNLVRDVVSNVILDSTYLYIASKEKLSKINQNNGQPVWTHELPEDLTSKSIIVLKDSLLCMVNMGYAYLGGKKINFGTPFILGLDPKTGNQRYNTIVSEKKDPINNFIIERDLICITFKNRIETYSLYSGTKLLSKTFNTEEFGELGSFVGGQLYTKVNDIEFKPLQLLDTTSYYIYTNKSKILALDKHFNVTNTLDYETLYYHYGQLNDYKLLVKDEQMILLDEQNNVRATLNINYNSIVKGNTLYNYNDKSLLIIDLSPLLNENSDHFDF